MLLRINCLLLQDDFEDQILLIFIKFRLINDIKL